VTSQARPGAAGSFAQRNPFMTGLMGGFLGAGLFGLLFGGGFGGAGLGGAGMLGLLLQLALIGGLGWLALRLWRGRQASNQPAFAHAGGEPGRVPDVPLLRTGAAVGGGGQGPASGDEISVAPADYDEFERVLVEVQAAWSRGDLASPRTNLTPEMLSYFSEGLTNLASHCLENHVEDVKLEQGDLSEAWREGGRDYATVAMRWSARDWTEGPDGAVTEGDREAPSEATEVWTFVRAAGGRWLLSAIQQV
jgi:predicted lipid-binding transport protein (Tim44 family)